MGFFGEPVILFCKPDTTNWPIPTKKQRESDEVLLNIFHDYGTYAGFDSERDLRKCKNCWYGMYKWFHTKLGVLAFLSFHKNLDIVFPKKVKKPKPNRKERRAIREEKKRKKEIRKKELLETERFFEETEQRIIKYKKKN